MTDFSNVILTSQTPGIGNYLTIETTLDCPATALSGFGSETFSTTVEIEKDSVLTMLQYKLSGIETVWRQQSGDYFLFYIPDFATATETIFVEQEVSGTTMTLSSKVADTSGSANTSPAYSVDFRVSLFEAPFS